MLPTSLTTLLSTRILRLERLFSGRSANYIPKGAPETWTTEQFDYLANEMGQASMETYAGAIKAASVVFWHSVLDAVTLDLCQVTTIVAPEAWDFEVGRKTVPLDNVRSSNYVDLRSRALRKRLEELDRESVVKKIEILYKCCGIEKIWSSVEGYSFDLTRVQQIDGRRHEIVHGNGLMAVSKINEADIDYLASTARHLCVMVAVHFSLKFAPIESFAK